MKIRVGYDIVFHCPSPTPMILHLNVHPSRASDLIVPDCMRADPPVHITRYLDVFDNICTRIVAPAGRLHLAAEGIVSERGIPDEVCPDASQTPIPQLPETVLPFLLGSRYCETDHLADLAWSRFGNTPSGWARVQAICDFVHHHLHFGYEHARPTKSALDAYREGTGVCRDYAHLAIALCRCVNVPARYCTGYLGDMGLPPPYDPMDFAGWFEAFLDGRWYTFDARMNTPRIGRILIARGRDASDVAISTSFGPALLGRFQVIAEEIAVVEPNASLD
jgi:transglutaminase-like putative cysteine protease